MVEHLVTQTRTEVHSSRLRFYCDSSLNVTEDLFNQVANDDGGYEIEKFLDSRWNNSLETWEVYVAWRGFDQTDYTWEPLLRLFSDAPIHTRRCISELPNHSELQPFLSSCGEGGVISF